MAEDLDPEQTIKRGDPVRIDIDHRGDHSLERQRRLIENTDSFDPVNGPNPNRVPNDDKHVYVEHCREGPTEHPDNRLETIDQSPEAVMTDGGTETEDGEWNDPDTLDEDSGEDHLAVGFMALGGIVLISLGVLALLIHSILEVYSQWGLLGLGAGLCIPGAVCLLIAALVSAS